MRYIFTLFLAGCCSIAMAKSNNKSYKKAVSIASAVKKKLDAATPATYTFTLTLKRFGHLSRPWQTYSSGISGAYLIAPHSSGLYISDSIRGKTKSYAGVTYYNESTVAQKNYGSNDWGKATVTDLKDFFSTALLYTPVYALNDFLRQPQTQFTRFSKGKDIDTLVYNHTPTEQVSILINKGKKEIAEITILYPHSMYGDQLKRITYGDYTSGTTGRYPALVQQIEYDTILADMHIKQALAALDTNTISASIPTGYTLQPEKEKPVAEILHTRYNEHIHLLELPHTDERSLLINFKDFLVVAEAPLNTANGELIIKKAAELFPGKPVRYFLFGHHHPHYLGGIRAFIHNGSTVLSRPEDTSYIRQLASFRRTITPDILEQHPHPLQLETIQDEKIITDGTASMRIIHIGEMSHHTDDYLIYYFPEYRLLFQDDLAWIENNKPLKEASERQKGVYDAIKKYDLPVETIIQGWPVKAYDTKSIFTFNELEESVKMIKQK